MHRFRSDLALAAAARFSGMAQPELEQGIEHGLRLASSLGLLSQRAILDLVFSTIELGSAFSSHPQVSAILNSRYLPPDVRVRALAWHLTMELKEEIRSLAAPVKEPDADLL